MSADEQQIPSEALHNAPPGTPGQEHTLRPAPMPPGSYTLPLPYPPPPEFYVAGWVAPRPPVPATWTPSSESPISPVSDPHAEQGTLAPQVMPATHPRRASILGVLASLLTAAISLAVYVALFGWAFGIGILLLLLVHEMGHFVVIRAKGLPVGLPIFIPLLGAYVKMQRLPRTVRDEAEIGIAGPIAGTFAGFACLFVSYQVNAELFVPLAYLSFLLNALNLIPVTPLDGGRIVGAISRWFWALGIILVGLGFARTHDILLLLLLGLGVMQLISSFRLSPEQRQYFRISLLARSYITLLYVGLIVVLALAIYATHGILVAHHITIFPHP